MIRNSFICKLINVQPNMKENNEKKKFAKKRLEYAELRSDV